MQLTSNFPTPSHLPTIHRLLALHLLRAREKAGRSRAQMAQQMAQKTDFSPQEIEHFESVSPMPDIVQVEDAKREQQARLSNPETSATKVHLLCFAPDLPPKLLTVENAGEAIECLLDTTRIRVFATDSAATLGFCPADGTQEEIKIADDGGEYTLLRTTETFLVLAGEIEKAEVPASAPRNEDLSWAPLVAWVPLCPHALDLAIEEDRKRLRLGSLSPLQVELALDKFAPNLPDGAVEDIMSAHPDGEVWMMAWN